MIFTLIRANIRSLGWKIRRFSESRRNEKRQCIGCDLRAKDNMVRATVFHQNIRPANSELQGASGERPEVLSIIIIFFFFCRVLPVYSFVFSERNNRTEYTFVIITGRMRTSERAEREDSRIFVMMKQLLLIFYIKICKDYVLC